MILNNLKKTFSIIVCGGMTDPSILSNTVMSYYIIIQRLAICPVFIPSCIPWMSNFLSTMHLLGSTTEMINCGIQTKVYGSVNNRDLLNPAPQALQFSTLQSPPMNQATNYHCSAWFWEGHQGHKSDLTSVLTLFLPVLPLDFQLSPNCWIFSKLKSI